MPWKSLHIYNINKRNKEEALTSLNCSCELGLVEPFTWLLRLFPLGLLGGELDCENEIEAKRKQLMILSPTKPSITTQHQIHNHLAIQSDFQFTDMGECLVFPFK